MRPLSGQRGQSITGWRPVKVTEGDEGACEGTWAASLHDASGWVARDGDKDRNPGYSRRRMWTQQQKGCRLWPGIKKILDYRHCIV